MASGGGSQAPQFAPPQFAPPGGPMYVPPGMAGHALPPGPPGAGGNVQPPGGQQFPPPGFDPISMMLNRMSMLEAQMMNVQAENAALRSRSDARGSVDTRLIGKPDVFSGKE